MIWVSEVSYVMPEAKRWRIGTIKEGAREHFSEGTACEGHKALFPQAVPSRVMVSEWVISCL